MPTPSRFDAAYYHRYYEADATRVSTPESVGHLCAGVVGMIRWFGGSLDSVLDVGAGVGLWRDYFAANVPGAKYRSVEVSAHACKTYGHEQRDITKWRARQSFDLVVCQGVLPYLSDSGARAAIRNLSAMTRGFLYLEAITVRDLERVCDRDLTDTAVSARPGSFYLSLLEKRFVRLGCGLFYVKDGPLQFYELESLD